jgi:hypothetical protein
VCARALMFGAPIFDQGSTGDFVGRCKGDLPRLSDPVSM